MPGDKDYIKRTFTLAKKAEGKTSPNPMVGCLIVKKGRIIAEGFHKRAGLNHAEIEALERAKGSLKQATLYVSLEPCFHWGRTPPCVDKIISSGIKKVVIAAEDPNSRVKGKSIRKLRKSGLVVKVGFLKKEAEKLNEIFFKNMLGKRPFVVAKVAQTLDGKIANSKGKSKWITSASSRKIAKNLRGLYDAVLVGKDTVIKDNPFLDSVKKKLVKVVLDPNLKIKPGAKLFKKASKVFIFTRKNVSLRKLKLFKNKASVIKLKYLSRGFDLKRVLKILYQQGVRSLYVEGGSHTLGKFFDAKLVDKIFIFLAPKIMGKASALGSISGAGDLSIKKLPLVSDLNLEKKAEDYLISGYPKFR